MRIADKTKWNITVKEEISRMIKKEPINEKITHSQMNWYGHLMWIQPNRITKRVPETKNNLKRKKGGPRKKWIK